MQLVGVSLKDKCRDFEHLIACFNVLISIVFIQLFTYYMDEC